MPYLTPFPPLPHLHDVRIRKLIARCTHRALHSPGCGGGAQSGIVAVVVVRTARIRGAAGGASGACGGGARSRCRRRRVAQRGEVAACAARDAVLEVCGCAGWGEGARVCAVRADGAGAGPAFGFWAWGVGGGGGVVGDGGGVRGAGVFGVGVGPRSLQQLDGTGAGLGVGAALAQFAEVAGGELEEGGQLVREPGEDGPDGLEERC
jgi:hypothetical protein